jgi:ferredoxin
MRVGDQVILDRSGLDALMGALAERGYETQGPVVRDGAIVPGPVAGVSDLPAGFHDEQAPGHYRLRYDGDESLFGWAVGPGSWKAELFPPEQELWRVSPGAGEETFREATAPTVAPLAVIGARPCELAALAILDRVLAGGRVPDPRYERRREGMFVVVAECGTPAGTCFCASMGTGPAAAGGYDLALTELLDERGHRFVVRIGSERGAEVLSAVAVAEVTSEDMDRRRQVLAGAEASMGRRLDTDDLAALLVRNLEHPRWDDVAERCLACGNCTLVCPTCFCSDIRDTSALAGDVVRTRKWASCFDLDHSYLHGGPVRASTRSRYRQWMTHKLSTWWDQFDTSGCVGCGRCITWCPVGIDLTEEVAAIRSTDGETTPGRQSRNGAP